MMSDAAALPTSHHAEAWVDMTVGRWGWQCLTRGCGAEEDNHATLGAAEAAAARHEDDTRG